MNDNDKKEFKNSRSFIVEGVQSEFVGPDESGDILIENPVTRYAAGMLFPVLYESRNEEKQNEKNDGEDDPQIAEEETGSDTDINNFGLANSFFPSVLGISFYCEAQKSFNAEVKWTKYTKIDPKLSYVNVNDLPEQILNNKEFKENFEVKEGKLFVTADEISFDIAKIISDSVGNEEIKNILEVAIARWRSNSAWTSKRENKKVTVNSKFEYEELAEGLEVICERKNLKNSDLNLITLIVKNNYPACNTGMDEEHVIFNVSISVESAHEQKEIFTEYPTPPLFNNDEEEQSLALLYKNKKTFAVGHGCAADWYKKDEASNASKIFTQILPTYEIPQIDFEIPGLDQNTLSMRQLSGEGELTNKEIIEKLSDFCNLYKKWIESLSKTNISDNFLKIANRHIQLCEESYARMMKGIELLEKNSKEMEAFKLANKAMLIQSLHSQFLKQKRDSDDLKKLDYNSEAANEIKWRPFQLGFLLLSLESMSDPNSDYRKIVDLIWFPTGGGKTEAYLGLSAFTIFLRRLKNLNNSGGTAVMMRYTLRLLTAQQFQRACTLICAMETIRQKNPQKFGDQEISIGLWVGIQSTPNTLDQAEQSFKEYIFGNTDRNPSPLLACPWCGTKIVQSEYGKRIYGYKRKTKPVQANIFCLSRECFFNERLPVLIVDEEIYRDPPTLLFGTVDKFAQMPLQKGVSSIFASNKDNTNLPPELIIQDELHLISGALGTLVGVYESAIDYLCSRKGVRPKIIASTATVRRAQEQCKNLFDRETRQFPANGINIEDSFFSKERPTDKFPGRLYLGLMPSGKTQTTASIRLSAALLRTVSVLPEKEFVKDKYWTLVSYFNSIRELGGYISLLYDDIPLYANALKQRYGGLMRHIAVEKELTSRKSAEDIPEILDQLSVSYPDKKAIDVLSATNMISVGMDIDRFGLMIIRGQPKLTSEYIQVSSRIGRKFPGLIITLYNSARTRDRAHYERFRTYHESFYRYVEPSSVTPFSAPARARALSAVLVTLFRHGLENGNYFGEDGASLFNIDLPELKHIENFLYNRVSNIDPDEAESTLKEFKQLLSEWDIFVKSNNGKVVYKNDLQGVPVMKNIEKNLGLWILPTSMRNVDVECNIDIKDE